MVELCTLLYTPPLNYTALFMVQSRGTLYLSASFESSGPFVHGSGCLSSRSFNSSELVFSGEKTILCWLRVMTKFDLHPTNIKKSFVEESAD